MTNQEICEMADKLKASKDRKKELYVQVKDVNAEIESLDLALEEDIFRSVELSKFSILR